MRAPNTDALISIVKNHFQSQEGSHDFHHIKRVVGLAQKIQCEEGGNLALITVAAWLHDISDHKFNGGSLTAGGLLAETLCLEHGADLEFASQVKVIVDQVSFRGAQVADVAHSLEASIVRDADRLDAIGAIGIARAFSYGGFKNRPLHSDEIPVLHDSVEAYQNAKSGTVNHFYEKLLLLKDRMQTKSAQKMALEKHDILLSYLEAFHKEWNIGQNITTQ